MAGIWLLISEYLRMGAWDLLQGFTARPGETHEPRLALQLVNEAALCTAGVRQGRSLSQKGFELANGLPFVAADQAIHELLNAHTVAQAKNMQCALGQIRRAPGHYAGRLLVIDDTILVTFYNAPNTEQLRLHYENLPDKLEKEGVEPRIPWFYGFKLDFRFK